MTSEATHVETIEHFTSNGLFGLKPSQLVIFQQQSLPCLTEEGDAILQDDSTVRCFPTNAPTLPPADQGILVDTACCIELVTQLLRLAQAAALQFPTCFIATERLLLG
ncbi:MAG: hypothetical protein HC869_12745 [Rhodospirillales bacterium]|nr:hypothetical protein [Rhodospirillales bacterium]